MDLFVKTLTCYIQLLLNKSFPDSKMPGTFLGHIWMPDTKSINIQECGQDWTFLDISWLLLLTCI